MCLTPVNEVENSLFDATQAHATAVVESVVDNPDITAEAVNAMPEDQRAALRRKLDTADKILDRCAPHN